MKDKWRATKQDACLPVYELLVKDLQKQKTETQYDI